MLVAVQAAVDAYNQANIAFDQLKAGDMKDAIALSQALQQAKSILIPPTISSSDS